MQTTPNHRKSYKTQFEHHIEQSNINKSDSLDNHVEPRKIDKKTLNIILNHAKNVKTQLKNYQEANKNHLKTTMRHTKSSKSTRKQLTTTKKRTT